MHPIYRFPINFDFLVAWNESLVVADATFILRHHAVLDVVVFVETYQIARLAGIGTDRVQWAGTTVLAVNMARLA